MPRIKAAIGVSASNATFYHDEIDAAIREAAATYPKIVAAIGACGLSAGANDMQADAFKRQIALARDLDLALVVEANGAHAETRALLSSEGYPFERVLVRAFEGEKEDLAPWADAGSYVSFSAAAAEDPVGLCGLVALLPQNRVLVESGAPHETLSQLAGFPARCDQVVFVADAMRDLVSAAQLAANTEAFFG